METGLAGKGVLITGASGGIGSACARAFADEGARVVLHFHRGVDRVNALLAESRYAHAVGGDLTDERAVGHVFSRAREHVGVIDICVAVAGWWPREDEPVWKLSLDRWRQTVDANLTSAFLTSRAFLREVERNGRGSLVLISSTAAQFGEAGHADYAAAKAALHGLLLSLKNEITRIAAAGRVNAVAPGWTESPMTRGHVDPEQVRRASRTMALRKVAQPEDVARAVVVLASDHLSGHITGQIVTVAGGMEGRTVHED